MAAIVQRASTRSSAGDDNSFLTEEEKEQLMKELDKVVVKDD